MPRRTQTRTTRPRPQVNITTKAPARRDCGCRLDGQWRCDEHHRQHLAADRSGR